MGVYDTATRLASEIKNSEEYKNFTKCMKAVKRDSASESLLKEFRIIQIEIQNKNIQNMPIDNRLRKKVEQIQLKISENNLVNDYLISEKKLMRLMENINKILAKTLEDDYK
jgi:cell fate (sporulation/competence/biofilm development) regulator YlbF (YheA/YmcA/DUF963 family)